jgi:N-acetylmuramoyl-L-alanine amidase
MTKQGRITHIVLHYSATYADQDLGVADIDKMHRARGWAGVGYHYVIKRDGTVQAGRPENQVGAHVGGQNTGKIGICLIGGLDRATGPNKGLDNRTDAQKASAAKLIREILTRHPSAQIVGHRDLAATQCPAYDAAAWWSSVNAPARPAAPTGGLWASIIAALSALFRKGN